MVLRHPENWVWDSWYVRDAGLHHAFYLQAPRALGDPELRHQHATVGHATSHDLRTWTVIDDALRPGPTGAWDDRAIWTGSAIRTDDGWAMLYTGSCDAEEGRVQRIGLATSSDLRTWTRASDAPVLEADPSYYETLPTGRWPTEAWRDPWLSRDRDGTYHALVTARVADRPVGTAGVVGWVRSSDLASWEVMPPLTDGSPFSRMEVLQVEDVGGEHVLCFSAEPVAGQEDVHTAPASGVWLARAEGPLGPFDLEGAHRLPYEDLYAARLVEDADGRWWVQGFVANRGSTFVGELADPVPFGTVWPG